jgi:hypothetical protein
VFDAVLDRVAEVEADEDPRDAVLVRSLGARMPFTSRVT